MDVDTASPQLATPSPPPPTPTAPPPPPPPPAPRVHSFYTRRAPPRSFACDVCATLWPSANALLKHSYTHSGEQPYECTVCSRRFSQLCNLNGHIRSVHDGVKFKCERCNEDYSSKNNLDKHLQKTHGKGPGVRCDECAVWMRGDLARHRATSKHLRMVRKNRLTDEAERGGAVLAELQEAYAQTLRDLLTVNALIAAGIRREATAVRPACAFISAAASAPAPASAMEQS